MKAAAYARYSTDKQTENSIDTQLSAITRYCRDHGHTLTSTFVDMAMSGTNTERPDFQRMLDSARARQFDCVVVYDISRASRDVGDWMSFRKLMRSLNIDVLSTTEKLGSIDNPNDFLTELLTAGLGQHMVLQTRQKSIAGVAEKAKHGVFLGGYPPLGYDVEDSKYIINQVEAEAVRLIFDLYARGESYDYIL
jgi:site-specific DNA recombinase